MRRRGERKEGKILLAGEERRELPDERGIVGSRQLLYGPLKP